MARLVPRPDNGDAQYAESPTSTTRPLCHDGMWIWLTESKAAREYAEIDQEVYKLLDIPSVREQLRRVQDLVVERDKAREEAARFRAVEALSRKLDLATHREDEGFAAIPIYSTDAEDELEGGIDPLVAADSVMAVKKALIWNDLKTNPLALAVYRIGGDFMEPTLRRGDFALVDRKRCTPRDGGIYVLHFLDRTTCRRIQLMKDRSIVAKSDNAVYEPVLIDPQEDKDLFVGRVIMTGRRVG